MNNIDYNFCGKTNFQEVVSILNNASLHIDGECGMVHMRHFMGQKRSVVLFGPTNINFYGYPENINITSNSCTPCEWLHNNWMKKCIFLKNPNCCMTSITPQKIIDIIKQTEEKKYE